MLYNYLITALRNFFRHKLYSFINIAGLAVGLACAIFILLFLRDELSYDAWVPDSRDLYRVESTFYFPGVDPIFTAETPFPAAPTIQAEIPEVTAQTHVIPANMTAQVGDHQFPVTVQSVDPNFFRIIKLPFVKGNPATAFRQPESIVLSETIARKFFGAVNPIGRTMTLGGSHAMIVTGILRDLPHNTHLSIDVVMPNTSKAEIFYPFGSPGRTGWLGSRGASYVKLSPHADLGVVEQKLKLMLDKHVDVKRFIHLSIPGSDVIHLHLTPFRYVHLAPFGETEAGRWETVYGFTAIAVLVLFIATINYVNLATARAIARAREVSLRKVVGATRTQLIIQFLGESVMTALVALALALSMVEILLPAFDSLLGRPITFNVLADWPLTMGILGVAVLTGVLGGIYPALVLSGFRPASNLGAGRASVGGPGTFRMALVVFQFAISIGLGVALIVIFSQTSYSRHINLGFNRHDLLVIRSAGPLSPTTGDTLTQALASDPTIAGAAQSDLTPFDGRVRTQNISLAGRGENLVVRTVDVDPNFLNVYGMKLLAGRNLSGQRSDDILRDPGPHIDRTSSNILINAAAEHLFGYTAAGAIGRSMLATVGPLRLGLTARFTIVGVVDDVNFDGLQTATQPLIYYYQPLLMESISVRIRPNQTRQAVAAVDRIWHRFVPNTAILRRFQDASFDKLFSDDEREGKIFAIFVSVAIFIAAMGLFGLAAFTTGRRTKEIGLRRTFGARTRDIIVLLLWQFSIPVLIANLIAWPVAYYYLHNWLESYAYRISLNPLYFVGAGLAALVIAWATVIAHAAHVARANPIHALRYE